MLWQAFFVYCGIFVLFLYQIASRIVIVKNERADVEIELHTKPNKRE